MDEEYMSHVTGSKDLEGPSQSQLSGQDMLWTILAQSRGACLPYETVLLSPVRPCSTRR